MGYIKLDKSDKLVLGTENEKIPTASARHIWTDHSVEVPEWGDFVQVWISVRVRKP